MSSGTLTPNPFLQIFTDAGAPLASGKVFTYAAETTTPAQTFSDVNLTTPNPNPIVLNAAGRIPSGAIFLTPGQSYKYVLQDVTGTTLATYDDIQAVPSSLKNAQFGIQTGGNFTTSVVYPVQADFTPFVGSITTRGGAVLAQAVFPAQITAGTLPALFMWNLDGADTGNWGGYVNTTYVSMVALQWQFSGLSVGTHQIKLRVSISSPGPGTFSSPMSGVASGSYSLLETNV
jgi:hypothetical protein